MPKNRAYLKRSSRRIGRPENYEQKEVREDYERTVEEAAKASAGTEAFEGQEQVAQPLIPAGMGFSIRILARLSRRSRQTRMG